MWRTATTMAACLVLLTGCAAETHNPPPGAATAGNDGVVEPTTPASLPSGIVFSEDRMSLGIKTLSAYDPATGQVLGTAAAPYAASVVDRQAFDTTMTRLAYVADCALHVATLAGGAYQPAGQWDPAQTYGDGKQCYADPVFKDGRIWARLGASKGDTYRLVSVDPGDPKAPARGEGTGAPRQEKQYTIAGRPGSDVRVYTSDGAISDVWVTGTLPLRKGQYLGDSYEYTCGDPIDDTTFLCSSKIGKQPFGSVAAVSVNRSAGTVSLKQVAPPTKASKTTALLGPDRKHLAIHDDSGWYTTALDAAAAPARSALSDQQPPGDLLFWS